MAASPPIPPDEPERLAALRRLGLLDSPADPAYQALAELAARLLGTEMAAVSLVDGDRRWTKAGVGLQHGDQDPREASFCAHAIAGDSDPWVVADATADPRFADHPAVTDGTVGFYAGAPVRTADGHAIGTLCVIDPQPHPMSDEDRATLRTLAASVSAHVEVRRQQLLAAASATELAAIIEHAPDAFISMDAEGRIMAFNRQAERLFGWERDEIIGLRVVDTIVPVALRDDHRASLAKAVARGQWPPLNDGKMTVPALRRDGQQVPIEVTIAAIATEDGLRFNLFIRDITERVEREHERAEETAALAALADVTSRLAGGVDDALLRDQICEAACRIADADEAVLFVQDSEGGLLAAGANVPELRDLRVAADAHSMAMEALRTGTPSFSADAAAQGWLLAARHGSCSIATQPVLLDGRCLGVLSVAWKQPRPQLGVRTSRLLGLLAHEAATAYARTALFARLAEQSRTDALTGVLNRRALDDELHLALLNARQHEAPVSVAMLDLDHFKAYNDTFGHTAGDTLLKGCCASWSAMLRAGDILARYGGEEFLVLLPGCAVSDAEALVNRLRAGMPSGQTCSAGVASWNGHEAISELLERADRALYRAKDLGRDAVCVA